MADGRPAGSFSFRVPGLQCDLVVVVFGVILTAGAWLVVLHGLSVDRAAEIEHVHRDNSALARTFEEHVRRVFQTADNALLNIKREFEAHGGVTGELTKYVAQAKRDPIVSQIGVVDSSGLLIVSAVPHDSPINISRNPTFQAHVASPDAGLYVGKPIITQLTGTWAFYLTRRLNLPDGGFGGVVTLGLDPGSFSDFYNQLEIGPDRAVLLVGRDGVVRARRFPNHSEAGQDLNGTPLFARLAQAAVGHHEETGGIDRLRRFTSYRELQDFPLVVAVSVTASGALAPLERRRAASLLATLGFSLFVASFCAVLIALARRDRRRSEALSSELAVRRRAEEALRQSEQFIRSILDTVDEGFIVVDRDYRILTANNAYCGQVSRTPEDVIGKQCFEISHRINRPCFEQGEECAVRRVFESGNPHTSVHKHPGKDGQIVFVETKAFPVKDGAGTIISVIETLNNITERHLLMEERLKTQKLESIGTLAGGIAHDFNNLLQGIFGYISMAKRCIDQKDRSLAMIEQAEKAIHQSVSLTTQLLTFSKGGRPVRELIALEPVIENAVKFALSGSRTGHRLVSDPDLWRVDADAGQLSQVIQNIALNAAQAMPLGGCAEIIARNVPPTDPELPPDLPRRNYVMISIRDTGVGLPEQDLERVFDPYFTTKEKGSGLGLATSYSIVKNHDGRIFARSKVGAGSTFFIYLPASEAVAVTPPAAPAAAGTRSARVLVMDDEEIIRLVAGELLDVLGHTAEFADRGETAIDAYREARDGGRPFDLVILDLTIRGGMGGIETVGRLREIDPDVKAVASSGYSDEAAESGYREQGFATFLKKPYDIAQLQETLASLLDGSNDSPHAAARADGDVSNP